MVLARRAAVAADGSLTWMPPLRIPCLLVPARFADGHTVLLTGPVGAGIRSGAGWEASDRLAPVGTTRALLAARAPGKWARKQNSGWRPEGTGLEDPWDHLPVEFGE